jgi:hypothetical protein
MLSLILASALSVSHHDERAFTPVLEPAGNGAVAVSVLVPQGFALYADRSKVEAAGGVVEVVTKPVLKNDPVMGPELLWRGEARWVVRGVATGSQIDVVLQGCNEVEQICYPPERVTLTAP